MFEFLFIDLDDTILDFHKAERLDNFANAFFDNNFSAVFIAQALQLLQNTGTVFFIGQFRTTFSRTSFVQA